MARWVSWPFVLGIFYFSLYDEFLGLHSQHPRNLADGLGMSIRPAVLEPPHGLVGQSRQAGQLPLGEDPLLPQALELHPVYLHIPNPIALRLCDNIISILYHKEAPTPYDGGVEDGGTRERRGDGDEQRDTDRGDQ